MQKGPLPKEIHEAHSRLVRIGQARARSVGKVFGRPRLYPDAVIRQAIQHHDSGETWAAVAGMMGISLVRLYARVRQLRRMQHVTD